MKKLHLIFAALGLFVFSLGITGCDPNNPNNPDMPAIVSTSEVQDGNMRVVEVIYKNNTHLFFKVISPTECSLAPHQYYYGSGLEFEQYAYSGDLVVPETITHEGVTYTVTSFTDALLYVDYNVTSVWIPKTVVGDNIINISKRWLTLNAIKVSSDNPKYASVDGHLFNNTKTKFLCYARANRAESYTVPDGVTEIDEYAFACCNLLTITLPNDLKKIGVAAFIKSSRLKTITIPNGVSVISKDAFFDCTNLTSITISNSVTKIGSQAFANCKSLKSVNIPEGLTHIEGSLFLWCESLNSLILPSSVTDIDFNVFGGCTSLTTLTCLATTPPVFSSDYNALSNIKTVKVPAGSVSAYRAAKIWKDHTIEAL